ncbi:MAG: DUF1553 domain-containing protein [Limisphaerales bacterium]
MSARCRELPLLLLPLILCSLPAAEVIHLRQSGRTELTESGRSPGNLIHPVKLTNDVSWRFDGRQQVLHSVPSNTEGFAVNFTWEGFFLTPKENRYSTDTGIADRFISQFAFSKGNWTRLAIGLVADRSGKPRLGVELEGFEGRTFGMGDRVVTTDRWHHFALVHEGTPDAARIRWFLDYRQCGEILLGGQANQNTLRPPGSAPFTVGARLIQNGVVNRGFDGFMDEVRLSPGVLSPKAFLRTSKPTTNEFRILSIRARKRSEIWKERQEWAARQVDQWMPEKAQLILDSTGPEIGDERFVRRLALAVKGRIPTLEEMERFSSDRRADKRVRWIDEFLASSEWADGWVGYWQDVLAENPSVVFPTLNNSGPFRQWIHSSFATNQPFDRFVTELLLMERKGTDDSPASFALATRNDAPMAMRANVALKAFAAVDLKCARCHDSPVDRFKQGDLFVAAAYLNNGPLQVPVTSVAAVKKTRSIKTWLKAGQNIEPEGLAAHWLPAAGSLKDLHPIVSGNRRAEFAALITSPNNPRFSDVIVNRVWKRLFGEGMVEPVDHWNEPPEDVDELRMLSAWFVRSGYDLKALTRLLLNSPRWQSHGETERRMTAEQLVDSLFLAVGKEFEGETMGVHGTDPGSAQLPQPKRSWQFAALPNERDRPALGMPVNQTIVDVLTTFGWNGSRQQPRTERELITTPLQPLILFNGVASQRIVRLSDRSAITELCLAVDAADELVEKLFLRVLSRRPADRERKAFVLLLKAGFEDRKTGHTKEKLPPLTTFQPDWRKHLRPEQSELMMAAQKRVALGEPATKRLTTAFRERVEDCVWALINSPEFSRLP